MFYVVGAANIDVFCKSKNTLILRDSNPSKISFKYGGVARNIACNLANQKAKVSFLTAFGNDAFGEALQKDLKKRGIDLTYSVISKDHSSSLYMAVLDQEDLFIGVNDMSVIEEINKETVSKIFDVIKEDDYVCFDTDYDTEFIAYLADNFKGIKVVDAVSANKVVRLKGIENKLDIVKCNLIEAEQLWGKRINNDEDCASCLKDILKRGVKEFLLSGNNYLFVGNTDGINKYTHDAYNPNPVNITGAGDALLAYYVNAKSKNLSEEECAKEALVAAIKTVTSDSTVVDVNLEQELININIRKEKFA